jgi:hypothetical protein
VTLSLRLENTFWEVGSPDFLNSFFSTVSYHLEPDGLGTRFPTLGRLYNDGNLPPQFARQLKHELDEARRELGRLSPDKIIWDSDDLSAKPPWGANISPDITDLSNYFVTSDGRDLFDVFFEVISEVEDSGQALRIG